MLLHEVKNINYQIMVMTYWTRYGKPSRKVQRERIRQEDEEKIRRKSTMWKKEMGDKTGKANQIREEVEWMKQDSVDVRSKQSSGIYDEWQKNGTVKLLLWQN